MSKNSIFGVATWGTGKATNANSASGYQSLGDVLAKEVTVSNSGAASIDLRKSGEGDDPVVIPSQASVTINLQGNTNEVEFKRSDSAASSYDVSYLWNA